MTLELALGLDAGTLDLAVELNVGEEIVAVLGPNGAGKTTLLRAIAGLRPIRSGHIAIDGVALDDPDRGVFVPPNRRPIGMVFQDYLLFPFLSAQENVAFPLRSRGVAHREARERAGRWLARVGLGDHLAARPSALSGGQAQRVALARAIVSEPRVLLLDEPLAALDAQARMEIRRELRAHLAQTPGARIIVTHDPIDASTLADRVVILEAGRVVQEGRMTEIAMHPRSSYVAELVGLNLYRGTARNGVVTLDGGGEVVVADHHVAGEVHVAVHPRAVALHLDDSHGSARNHWRGHITELDDRGDRVRVRLEGALAIVAEITPDAARELGLTPGREAVAVVKATEVQIYPT